MLVDDAQIERRAAEEPQILLLAKEKHFVILRGHQIRVVLILIAYVLERDDLRSVKQMVTIERAELRSCIPPDRDNSKYFREIILVDTGSGDMELLQDVVAVARVPLKSSLFLIR